MEKLIADDGIDCAYARTGHLYLAHRPGRVAELEAAAREYEEELGEAARFVPRDELRGEIGSDRVLRRARRREERRPPSGPVLRRVGPPGARRRRRRARAHAGASPSSGGRASGFRVAHRPRERSTAARCSSRPTATPRAWCRGCTRRILPIGSYIIATEPLPDRRSRARSRRTAACSSTRKNFLYYWRLSPDNRVLFGGRTSFAPTTVRPVSGVPVRGDGRACTRSSRASRSSTRGVATSRSPSTACRTSARSTASRTRWATAAQASPLSGWFGRLAAAWLAGDEPDRVRGSSTWRRVPATRPSPLAPPRSRLVLQAPRPPRLTNSSRSGCTNGCTAGFSAARTEGFRRRRRRRTR